MVVRRRKKARKYDGRTHGRGCAKRGRGSGEKGGKGWSGGHKQKWSYILRYFPDHFGKHGFVARERPEPRTINVGEIDERIEELLERGLAERKGERIAVDVSRLGAEKVLGGGRVEHALELRAPLVTEAARSKVEAAGGLVVGESSDERGSSEA
ncbi:MAG: 50S ribosomal protein L15 [Hadesarchaea archaeon]|jgi:large subunit ribosomal protein L15|nr:50S ribosomal protein L15 [Hadesarchaea archaeon]